MRLRALLLVSLGLFSGACSGKVTAPDALPKQEMILAGVRVTLEANLVRDFMPMAPADGRPMLATFTVRSADGVPLPAGLVMTSAAITFGGETWRSTPAIVPMSDPTILMGQSRDGPKWGPGGSADVVVTLEAGGARGQLGAAQQPIRRTD